MKHFSKILLMVVMLAVSLPSLARVISVDEARQIAGQYGLQAVTKAAAPQAPLSEPAVVMRNGQAALYIFNRAQGGFIIVSADDATQRQVLGWSDRGSYDPENVPVQLADIIDSYASGIGLMRVSSSRGSAAILRTESSLPDSVSPLLKDIAWGQMQPYNEMCPTYTSGQGGTSHYPTGCVATAIGQIMKYHGYPAKGKGSHSYQWKDTTMSADFSKSTYLWDKMLPDYNNGVKYTQEQVDAVALLIHDLGIALNMQYASGGSGTAFYGYELVNYFDYGKGLKKIHGDYCTVQDWEEVLRSELAAGYPVLCEGGSTVGGHEFLCDGYNAEGLFHYNFGWDGVGNGWFASNATGFDASPSITYGIRPVSGGEAVLSIESEDDFKWAEGNTIVGSLSFRYSGLERTSDVITEFGLALRDTVTSLVTYYTICPIEGNYLGLSQFSFVQSVPDGAYKVYPVARPEGKEQWQTFLHNELCQIEIDLTVEGGVQTWQNKGLQDPIDEGVVLVEGIYYTLDDNKMEATVTRRNSKNPCYSGYVVVPEEVTYQDKKYVVTSIGGRAFENCAELDSVLVGSNVTSIGLGSFGGSSLKAISFAKGSKLSSMESGWAFNACLQLEEVILPEGLLILGMCTFQSCSSLKNAVIPSSVTGVAPSCFNACTSLESIHVKWTSLDNVYWADNFSSDGLTPGFRLYVPKGCAGIYNVAPFTFCTIVEEDEPGPSEDNYLYIVGCDNVWNPAVAADTLYFRTVDSCYVGDMTVVDADGGYGYFCIGTVLSSDWDVFNANRMSAPSADYLIASGATCALSKGGDASFKAQSGKHHVVVDLKAGTLAFDCPDGIVTVQMDEASPQMFDLNGRRIDNLQPGQIVIISGRKYIF